MKEKIYYTASGIPIPESCIIELDKNNLVAVWNWRKLKLWKRNNTIRKNV